MNLRDECRAALEQGVIMRDAQRAYFKNRKSDSAQTLLIASKQAETKFDSLAAAALARLDQETRQGEKR